MKEAQRKRRKISHLTDSFKEKEKTTSRSSTPSASASASISELASASAAESLQWIDKYSPRSLDQVAIHNRKLKDVRSILEPMVSGESQCKILVLTGPSGCSKSTVIKLLSQELIEDRGGQIPYIEWINPLETHRDQFDDFLQSVRFRRGVRKSIVLVEDIPNVFHEETRERLRKSLMQWAYSDQRTPPLVICITECDLANEETMRRGYSIENNYNAETILGKKLLNAPTVHRIKFNPVNATLIKKTLNSIVKSESAQLQAIPSNAIKDEILKLSTFGDIRSAISALEFWCKLYHEDTANTLNLGKEQPVSIFHAVGKCVYGSKSDEDDNVTTNQVVKDFITRPSIMKLALLENYTSLNKSQFPLSVALEVADGLSLADTIVPEGESLEISTRAVRTSIAKVTATGSSHNNMGLVFPREWKVQRRIQRVKNDVSQYMELELRKNRTVLRSFQDSNQLFGDLEPLINRQLAFKNKSKVMYMKAKGIEPIPEELFLPKMPYITERLGGTFINQQVVGDETPTADDDVDYASSSNNLEYFKYRDMELDSTSADLDGGDNGDEEEDPIVTDSDIEDTDQIIPDVDDTFERELVQISQRPTLQKTLTNLELLEDLDDGSHDFDDSDF